MLIRQIDITMPPTDHQGDSKTTVIFTQAIESLIAEYCTATGITKADFVRTAAVRYLQDVMGIDYVWEKLRGHPKR